MRAIETNWYCPTVKTRSIICGSEYEPLRPSQTSSLKNASALSSSTTASNLPTDLKANVKWELSTLPGASTPIVDDTQIYLTAVDPEKKQLVVFAVDRKTGKLVWEDRPHTGFTVPKGDAISLHNRSNYASPSAVTDGERVIFTFGNGDMHSY